MANGRGRGGRGWARDRLLGDRQGTGDRGYRAKKGTGTGDRG